MVVIGWYLTDLTTVEKWTAGETSANGGNLLGPVNAYKIHSDQIKTAIGKKSIFLNALNFVNVSDNNIRFLFVTDRVSIRKRHKEGIFLPPLSHRQSAKQITDYFSLGIRDKERIRDDSASWTIAKSHKIQSYGIATVRHMLG